MSLEKETVASLSPTSKGGTYGFTADYDDNARAAYSSNQRTSGISSVLGKVSSQSVDLGANKGQSKDILSGD